MERDIDMLPDLTFNVILKSFYLIIKFLFSGIAALLIIRSIVTKLSIISLYILLKPVYFITDFFVKPINLILPKYYWRENPYAPLFAAIIIVFLGIGILSFLKIVIVN